METPSFALPTVNIGLRQEGRERARNILDCPADRQLDSGRRSGVARSDEFRKSLAGMTNPYGDGHACGKNRAGSDHRASVAPNS